MAEAAAATQKCRSCGDFKPVEEFDVRADTARRRTNCKTCRREYQRERWECSSDVSRSSRITGEHSMYPCRRCGEVKVADEFPRRSRTSQHLQSWCKECSSKYKAERHLKHHDREMERIRRNQRAYVARNLELVGEYLVSHPCVDCGESDPIVLDFDHLRDKEYDVSTLVHNGYPWARILKEIAKCEVRCSNDHRRATYRRRLEAKGLQEERGAWRLAS